MLQIILTVVFYVWLFGVLAFLWLNYRANVRREDVALKSAEAAQAAAEAARKLAAMLEQRQT